MNPTQPLSYATFQTHAMMVFCKPYPTQPIIMLVTIQLFTKRERVKCFRNGWIRQFVVHYHSLAADSKYGYATGNKDPVILWWPQCVYLNSSVVCWAHPKLSWKPSFKYQSSSDLPCHCNKQHQGHRFYGGRHQCSIFEQLWYLLLVFCYQLSL